MNKDEIFEINQDIRGALSRGDMEILYHLATQIPENGMLVEVGCYYGKSTHILYKSKKNSVLMYSIDKFVGTVIDPAVQQYEILINNMSNKSFYPRIMHGDSDAAIFFDDNSIDLIFIDADHSYEGVKKDILNFIPKMKKKAIMCGHDYDGDYNGVKKAVDEIFEGKNIVVRDSNYSTIWTVEID